MNAKHLFILAVASLTACHGKPPSDEAASNSELTASGAGAEGSSGPVQQVTKDNFIRAETDNYFAGIAKEGAFGKFTHSRDLADVQHQTVVRMNRDTLYSHAIFDLDAGPVTITLPDPHGRFMSLLLIDEDHYNPATIYAPGPHKITKEQVGTRYVMALVRTFVDPNDPKDLAAVHALQDQIKFDQSGGPGQFEIPNWDHKSLAAVRDELKQSGDFNPGKAFGTKKEVDERDHLIGTARGWGGNPERDAFYISGKVKANDGKTVHRLTVRDIPVDGFWSISVYNKEGFFEPNPLNSYSLNNVTAKKAPDGSYTIQFGGCDGKIPNCLPITPGWNYTVRLYRPRAEILNGSWKFPDAQPVT